MTASIYRNPIAFLFTATVAATGSIGCAPMGSSEISSSTGGKGDDPGAESGGPTVDEGATPPGFVTIEPGTFTMGSPADELARQENERPHEVTLTRTFHLAEAEVTKTEWTTEWATSEEWAMTSTIPHDPSGFSPERSPRDCGDCPIEHVTWWEALAYANERSVREGLVPCYELIDCVDAPGEGMTCSAVELNSDDGTPYGCEGYRLPTEAEWEYAYRAGSESAFPNGAITNEFEDDKLTATAWYKGTTQDDQWGIHPVKTKDPNRWGLYDMGGNVDEMVWDYLADYPREHVEDPAVSTPGEVHDPPFSAYVDLATPRVVRGGGWSSLAGGLRAAYRNINDANGRSPTLGLRLARTAAGP